MTRMKGRSVCPALPSKVPAEDPSVRAHSPTCSIHSLREQQGLLTPEPPPRASGQQTLSLGDKRISMPGPGRIRGEDTRKSPGPEPEPSVQPEAAVASPRQASVLKLSLKISANVSYSKEKRESVHQD
ncbi:uncharacterized protein LOC112613280 [Theropithecus gelada]|uniref:uncharacterized protein LOC112613280 n=1 Tax=Theropithecus gelada TaxID=9565 RepID=UPI000DC1960D|nr:uncharacterized protein LOC112613280 [Theropithecus gelada]